MKDLQSYAEMVKGLLGAILADCTVEYPNLAKEFRRDKQRLDSAIDCHGVQFALITMPSACKLFDKSLADGRLSPFHLNNFGVDKTGIIPRLFRGLFLRVFDRQGDLLASPDTRAIQYIRQLLGVAKRMRIACDDVDIRKAVEHLIETDTAIASSSFNWLEEWSDEEIEQIGQQTFNSLLTGSPMPLMRASGLTTPSEVYANGHHGLLDNVQLVADIIASNLGVFDPSQWRFRQGPGAVSDQTYDSYKYEFSVWPERLETSFPYAEFAVANWACVEESRSYEGRWDREIPARLIAVPKTLDKPRLIASEPVSHQWCQQSIRSYFYDRTRNSLLGWFVDYTNQTLSGDLALKASIDGCLSTVDLSEASDRISLPVVERLFRHNASLLRALRSSRSAYLRQDIHPNAPKFLKLRKYSTMGNATTFPVQSTLFTVLALACTLYTDGVKPSMKAIARLRGQVRVFGDDIVIPTRAVGQLLELLPALGLKVNVDKTFYTGRFRESCGVDAYAGVNIAPARVLDVPEKARPGSIVSTVDVHNNFLSKGLFHTAAFLRKRVPPMIERKIMEVEHGSGMFGFQTFDRPDNHRLRSKWSRNLSRRMLECINPQVKTLTREPNSTAGLLQFFTESVETVTSAVSRIGNLTSRPKTKLGLRWVPVG